jgi:hypothetical protein
MADIRQNFARLTAVKAKTQVLVALKSLLVTADETLRTQLESYLLPNYRSFITLVLSGVNTPTIF